MMPIIMKVTTRTGRDEYINVNCLISYIEYGAATEAEGPLTLLNLQGDSSLVIKGSVEDFHKMLEATLALFRCEWRSKL
jgi:hypothetical protein